MIVRMIAPWAMTALAAAALSPTAGAAPAARSIADAHFVSYDGAGCVATDVAVFARTDGSAGRLRLVVTKVDECKGQEVLRTQARATLSAGALRVASDLSSAALNTVLNVNDPHTRRSFAVTIRLSWTADEPVVAADTTVVPDDLGQFSRGARRHRTLRLAKATGSITVGVTNLAPQPAIDAAISSSQATG